MNEFLCRALARSGLGEEDVAARLGVDPKTVRRWMEGRMPFRRHRWALAAMLGVSDADLWPGLFGAVGRPGEVAGVYPRRDEVPARAWLALIGSARREVGILEGAGPLVAGVPGALRALAERAGAGVTVRICLAGAGDGDSERAVAGGRGAPGVPGRALAWYGPLRRAGDVQVRMFRDEAYSELCFSDDQMLVTQMVHGIPPGRCPVLHLERRGDAEMFTAYRDSFCRTWPAAGPESARLGDHGAGKE